MKKVLDRSLATAAGLLLWSSLAGAVPAGFNVQGRLTDSSGVNRNGSYSIKFSLFDSLTGGTLLWTQTFPTINVVNGNFQTTLADAAGQTPLVTVFAGADTRFLEFDVISGPGVASPEPPMVPRQQLVSVPFALRAGSADAAASVSSTSVVTVGTQGLERMRVDASGNVGVGTSAPAYPLDVSGDINLTGSVRRNGVPLSGFGPGSLAFGGLFFTGGSPNGSGYSPGVGPCVSANPATGTCSCPSGFTDNYYYVYQAGGINCGWTAGYTATVPCYGQYIYIHQCWMK